MSNLVKVTPTIELAKAPMVPDFMKATIPQDDWDAMPLDERAAAIDFFRAEMAKTTEGLTITFPRIKYPTSGSGVFESPTATGTPEYLPAIEGVIIDKRVVRAYWPIGDPIANNPPTCSSPDGKVPLAGPGRQADTCDTCRWSQFGTGKEQSGQACKQRINVFLLRDHAQGTLDEIPTLLSVPPSQLKVFSDFAVQVRKAKSTLLSNCTRFGLTDATSRSGVRFKGLALSLARKLTYAEMVEARKAADVFGEQMALRGLADVEEEDPPTEVTNDATVINDPTVIDVTPERTTF